MDTVDTGKDKHYLVDDTSADININYYKDEYLHNNISTSNQFIGNEFISEVFNDLPDFNEDYDDIYDELKSTESGKLLKRITSNEGIGDHHVLIYDNWLDNTIKRYIESKILTFEDGSKIIFRNNRFDRPSYTRGTEKYPLMPKMAREQGVTYGVDLYLDMIKIDSNDIPLGDAFTKKNVYITNIPLMLKSKYCYLRGKSKADLARLGEDPNDPSGYFIVEGSEKIVLGQEQLITDKILLMNTNGYVSSKLTANTNGGTVVMEISENATNNNVIEMLIPGMKPPKSSDPRSFNVLRIFRLYAQFEQERLAILGEDANELSSLDNSDNIKNFIERFIENDPNIRKKSIMKLNRTLLDFNLLSDDRLIISKNMDKKDEGVTDDEIRTIFDSNIYPHLNNLMAIDGESDVDHQYRITMSKLNLLAIMTGRLLEHLAGFRELDNRDSWSNKRVEGAGRLMETLFRLSWKKTLEIAQGHIKNTLGKDDIDKFQFITTGISQSTIVTCTFRDSFISGKWGMKGTNLKDAVAQPLNRDGAVATLAHVNAVDVAISRTDIHYILRLVQMDQFGFISAFFTPEGKGAGLLKNSCITAKLTVGRDDTNIIRHLLGDEGRDLKRLVALTYQESLEKDFKDKIIVAGKFIGWGNGEIIRNELIGGRRKGEFYYDMSVIKEKDYIYVDVSPSRMIRPVLLVNPKSQESEHSKDEPFLMIDLKNKRKASNHELVVEGCMEYISPWEQEYIKLAMSVDRNTDRWEEINKAKEALTKQLRILEIISKLDDKTFVFDDGTEIDLKEAENRVEQAQEIYNKKVNTRIFTHCEIDPLDLADIAASLIPWPDHNQAPRNTYQVSMGKQALGTYHSNHINRMNDGNTKILVFPQRPLVETDMYGVIGLDMNGPGENVIQQFLSIPFTEEDSFVKKKEFLDNGGLRMYKYITYKTIINNSNENWDEELGKPSFTENEKEHLHKYQYMSDNGLPMIGAPLREGDYIIGKILTPKKDKSQARKNDSVVVRIGDQGVVEKISISSNNLKTTVIVKMRVMRVPEEGDKYAPRNAQKGTDGLIVSDVDLQYGLRGTTADITANSHCFTKDATVSLKNGLSKPLTSLLYDGGDKVVSWDEKRNEMLFGTSAGYESQGVKDIVQLTFSDGRKIKCTPNHKYPVMELIDNVKAYRTVRADEITEDMFVLASYDCVLDVPSPDENGWTLKNEFIELKMDTDIGREKSLAFVRLLGFTCADGNIGLNGNYIRGALYAGSLIDTDMVLDDIELLTKKRPKICDSKDSKDDGYGIVFVINLPSKLARAMGSLEGMTIGRRSTQTPEWPKFLFENDCPKSIIREFLGGLFGGDGWCPYLMTNNQDGHGTVTFNPPAISMSSRLEFSGDLKEKMKDISVLLQKFGIINSRVEEPKKYDFKSTDGTIITNVRCNLQLSKGTTFGDKVGFRYCVQKMFRQAAYQSYMRYLENVKRQNDTLIMRASEIYESNEVGRSLQKALDKSRIELFTNETPLNDYYSNVTLYQLQNRRRPERRNELTRWDYKYIEDADEYLRKIDAYHWFRIDGKGGADYIIDRESETIPNYYIKLHEIRQLGKEEVFDFGVQKTHYLVVNNIVAANSLPSRMTMAYSQEIHAAKSAAMVGTHVNASAHNPYEMDKYRNDLKRYGLHEFAYEEMRSGTTGQYLEVLISSGPVFFQALRHHVKDKIQARGIGQVNPQTRQPLRGRTNRGGLRFGEMERDVAIAYGASAFLRERLMGVSDEYQTVFCIVCGEFAVNDQYNNFYKTCSLCGNEKKFGKCSIPYVYKLLMNLVAAAGLNLRPELMTNAEYALKILPKEKRVNVKLLEEEYDETMIDENEDEEEAEDAEIELEEQAEDEDVVDDYNEGGDYEGYDY